MDIAALTERFEFYAQQHKAVLHVPGDVKQTAFLLFDLENLNAAIKNGLKLPCILLQTPEIIKQGENDSISEHYECAFMVLKQLPKNDLSLKPGIVQDCKAISDQVFNRIYSDAYDGMFDGFLTQTAEGLVGPVGDSLYGWGVNFGFEQGYDGTVHNNDWEDLTP